MIKCKNCSTPRPVFALGPEDCDKCRPEKARDLSKPLPVNIGSAEDIKALGYKLLQGSDYRINKYTIEEPDSVKLSLWRDWRKEVRSKIRTCKDGDIMVFPEAPN